MNAAEFGRMHGITRVQAARLFKAGEFTYHGRNWHAEQGASGSWYCHEAGQNDHDPELLAALADAETDYPGGGYEAPGQGISILLNIALPANLPPGACELMIRLPPSMVKVFCLPEPPESVVPDTKPRTKKKGIRKCQNP
jgi:hypothetical protein